MKLLIVIPAFNEEKNIRNIIERTLAARALITRNPPVKEVEITVVSDGSTDRTAELAGEYKSCINLIIFNQNQGYGAAIKEAWKTSSADLLGFLDADGTCDPYFFADLCRALEAEKADIVSGCRIHSASRMPLIRKAGNVLFASVLTAFSARRIRDAASGMRVIRRECLPLLTPLPNGLDFTPAMSARAVLSGKLKTIERDIPYHKRIGESKLKIGADGYRFLKVIFQTALRYRPFRVLGFAGGACFLFAGMLIFWQSFFYYPDQLKEEWVLEKAVWSAAAFAIAALFFAAASLSGKSPDELKFDSNKRQKMEYRRGIFPSYTKQH